MVFSSSLLSILKLKKFFPLKLQIKGKVVNYTLSIIIQYTYTYNLPCPMYIAAVGNSINILWFLLEFWKEEEDDDII